MLNLLLGAGLLPVALVVSALALFTYARSQLVQTRELLERPPAAHDLAVELVPVYSNGATGAVARIPLSGAVAELHEYPVPLGAVAFRVLVSHRAGLYAGDTTTVERESEPPPAFLGGRP